jgi:amidase
MSPSDEEVARFNAFLPGARVRVAATGTGPLDGLRFGVKDLIDVAGVTTGGGNPDWLATHGPAAMHAASVASLLAAGASVDGKTLTDELAYSLEGDNFHYGTPVNPRWPQALPGGSSSGSAVAVACEAVDFALGTDTGGSVRVPAAFCGLWGIRPTHDAVSPDGVLPFAPCFDTVGWFARSAPMLETVGKVLLAGVAPARPETRASKTFVRFDEAFVARAANEPVDAERLHEIAGLLGALDGMSVFEGEGERWLHVYQRLQDADIRASLGEWIAEVKPRFGPTIAARFARLQALDGEEVARCRRLREQWRARLDTVLAAHYLVLPTTPLSLLPKADGKMIGGFYHDALMMNAVAAFGGYPQLTIPFVDGRDRPLALSIIGARGDDLPLMALVKRLDVAITM